MKTCPLRLSAALLSGIGILATGQAMAAEHAVIAQYHHVSTETPPSTSISPSAFEEHMRYLKASDFTVWPLPRLIEALRARQPLPERTVAITFDDGYFSVYEEAFPLLQQMEFPFTVFVNTQPIDDNLAGFMNWEQIREMSEARVTIANHTANHPYMLERSAGESEEAWLDRQRSEILEAELRIEKETGQSHKLLAYPYGEYSLETKSLVQELDFVALGQHSGAIGYRSDFLALPRFPFSGVYARQETFKTKMETLPFNVLLEDPADPVTTRRSPELELRIEPGNFDMATLACYGDGKALPLKWLEKGKGRFRIVPEESFLGRRWRYNCTAPEPRSGRFYWYSRAWIQLP